MDTEEKEKNQPTARDSFMARVKEKYPDYDYEDEDARYGAYNQYLDEVTRERDKYRESDQKFADAYSKDPRFAAIAQEAVKEDGDVTGKMIEVYGKDVMDAWNDPDQIEALTEAQNKYLANVAETEEIRKQQEANKAETDKVIAEYLQENNMSPEEGEKFLEGFYTMIEDALLGIIKREYLESYAKAQNYESDLRAAAVAGEVKAKNERAERQVKKEIGDGVPDVSQGQDDTQEKKPKGKGMTRGMFYN